MNVPCLDLPTDPWLVPDPDDGVGKVDVVVDEQVREFPGAQAGEREGEEDRELPVVTRLEEGLFLLDGERPNRFRASAVADWG